MLITLIFKSRKSEQSKQKYTKNTPFHDEIGFNHDDLSSLENLNNPNKKTSGGINVNNTC